MRPLFAGADPTFVPKDGHILYAGASGTGKTQSILSLLLRKLSDPLTGVVVVDPDGEICPVLLDMMANPANGLGARTVHHAKPASRTHAFALPNLHVPDRNPLACHNAAVRTKEIFQQAVTVGAGDYGPRLSKLFYMGCLGLALAGRPLIDLPDLYTRGAGDLRDRIGAALPFPFVRDEWHALDLLPDRTFLEYRDALMSRLMPIFGNAQLRRVFGPQPPLDIARVLRQREVVLLDLGGLEHADAVLVGKALYTLVHHTALERTPNREPHVFVCVDEAFDYLSNDLARGFDRLRKRNVQLCLCIQRLAQLDQGEDDTVSVMSAILSNTRTKVVFRMEDPDDAETMTRVLFTGFVPLNEWKAGSERPVVVAHHREITLNRSTADHAAEHTAISETTSIARGVSRTHMLSVTEADGESESEATIEATGLSTSTADISGSSLSSLDGVSASTAFEPYTGGMFAPPTITGVGTGASSGTGLTSSTARSAGRARSSSSGTSRAISRSRMSAVTEGVATTESEVVGHATGRMHGTSRGRTESHGESEAIVATLEWLPSHMWSLQEQLHCLAGEIKTLALRECFVKVDNAAPVRARTMDRPPAFKSAFAKRILLPLFQARTIAGSPYLLPVATVDAMIAARGDALGAPPAFETTPEPMPVIDDPDLFARGFWERRETPPKRTSLTTRPPLRVIDGDGGDKAKE